LPRQIDHIVYATPDLEQSIEQIAEGIGIRPVIGGRHLTKGTKNALLHLGGKCYLEILAIDEESNIEAPRWMGIDEISSPRVTRFCLRSHNLEEDAEKLTEYNTEMGVIEQGSRKMSDGGLLQWNMILPLAKPEVDLIPFVCHWPEESIHPTEKLEEGATLDYIRPSHPQAENLKAKYLSLGIDFEISKSEKPEIRVGIKGPKGTIELA